MEENNNTEVTQEDLLNALGPDFLDTTQDGNTQEGSATQENNNTQENQSQSSAKTGVIRGNSKSKIYHCPGQSSYENMADSKYLVTFDSEDEAIAAGYRKAQK